MVEQLRLGQMETPDFLDTIYSLLANSHRRNALQYLLTHPNPVSIDRLSLELAAIEYGVDAEDVTVDHQQAVHLHLKHVHLPVLHDAGVITTDRDAKQVALTPLLDQLTVTVPNLGQLLDSSGTTRPETH